MGYIRAMQNELSEKGKLQINVTSSVNSRPIGEAEISISYTGVPENILERLTTDSSGQTEVIDLDAPATDEIVEKLSAIDGVLKIRVVK